MTHQLNLFDNHSDGDTYLHERDHDRLTRQRGRVWDLIKNGEWRTIDWIASYTGDPATSVSARLRDFRKEKFGGHDIERRHIDNGLWEYRRVTQ